MTKLVLTVLATAVLNFPAQVSAQAQPSAYERGVAERLAGHSESARRLLVAWLKDHPGDVDAMLQLAYAELALGDLEAARGHFRFVLAKAPDYADASQGLKLVEQRSADKAVQDRGFVRIDGAASDLSNGTDWSEAGAEAEFAIRDNLRLGGRLTRYRRFATSDLEWSVQASGHPSANLWWRAHIGSTPHADFRPRHELGAGLDIRTSQTSNTVFTMDARYQKFPGQSVTTMEPGLVRYLANGKAWITLRGIGVVAEGDKWRAGGLVRGDVIPADRWRLFAGLSNGPDTEIGVVSRVTSAFAGVEAPVARRLTLDASISREWRKSGFNRNEFRLGLRVGL